MRAMQASGQGGSDLLGQAAARLREIGKPAEEIAWPLLLAQGDDDAGAKLVRELKAEAGLSGDGDAVERVLLRECIARALPKTAALPVEASVRTMLEKDLSQFVTSRTSLEAGTYLFNRAAKMATLRRFPAGPMEWEVSGIPRSWFLQAGLSGGVRLAAFVAAKLGGLKPCMFLHVGPHPRNRSLVLEREMFRTYYRLAKSLELQPELRAILACAWFHDPAAVRDHPHLEPVSRPYLQHGGLITPLGPAPPDSGVLEGNAQRRSDYLAGKVQYRMGFAIWPREAAVRWATDHPELAG